VAVRALGINLAGFASARPPLIRDLIVIEDDALVNAAGATTIARDSPDNLAALFVGGLHFFFRYFSMSSNLSNCSGV
jgi:hypothetical protein